MRGKVSAKLEPLECAAQGPGGLGARGREGRLGSWSSRCVRSVRQMIHYDPAGPGALGPLASAEEDVVFMSLTRLAEPNTIKHVGSKSLTPSIAAANRKSEGAKKAAPNREPERRW